MDQGVGADFVDHLFAMILDEQPGTQAQRASASWPEIAAYDDRRNVQDRLKEFNYANISEKMQMCHTSLGAAVLPAQGR